MTDYFFTNVTNTILVEAISLSSDGSHAYLSAKIVANIDSLTVSQTINIGETINSPETLKKDYFPIQKVMSIDYQ